MPRIRTIKPEFWNDKKVASWPIFTRLLFIGLWTAADDHGRGSAEPARLSAELFPYDLSRDPRETLASVAAGLDRLAADSRITLYEVGGETFYEVSKWRDHQRVDNAGKPKVPTPYEGVARPSRDSRETCGELPLEQGTGSREQVDGKEASASCSEPPSTSDSKRVRKPKLEGFDRFYAAYPRRVSRADAEKAWSKIHPEEREQVIEAAKEFAAAKAGSDPTFLPYPAKWLNGRRWLDDRAEWRAAANGTRPIAPTGSMFSPYDREQLLRGMAEADAADRAQRAGR